MVSIVFAGVGGQGIVTVATLVGRAAVLDGENALMTELHGMAQRGGKISVELRIGNYKSAIIPARSADILVAFEKLEAVRNIPKLREDGIILLNEREIHPISISIKGEEYPREFIESQLRKYTVKIVNADGVALSLGNKRVSNMAMVGALYSTGLLGISVESIVKAMEESIEGKYWDVNRKAFEIGKSMIKFEVHAKL